MGTNLHKVDEELPIREQIAKAVFEGKFTGNTLIKDGPHIGSEFTPSRLFGGQMIAQSYTAFRLLFPNDVLSCLSFKFLIAGSCDLPIAYSVKRHGNLARVIVLQNKKTIATCTIRIKENGNDFPSLPKLNLSVPCPSTIDKDQQFFKELGAGREINMDRLLAAVLFEIYKIEMTDRRMLLWTRIHPETRKYVKPIDRVDVCLMYTDFFTFQVCCVHLAKFGLSLAGGSSLSHNVQLHLDPQEIDVYDYHLFEVNFESFTWNRALLRAVLYDRSLRPILSVHQECYILPKGSKINAKL